MAGYRSLIYGFAEVKENLKMNSFAICSSLEYKGIKMSFSTHEVVSTEELPFHCGIVQHLVTKRIRMS